MNPRHSAGLTNQPTEAPIVSFPRKKKKRREEKKKREERKKRKKEKSLENAEINSRKARYSEGERGKKEWSRFALVAMLMLGNRADYSTGVTTMKAGLSRRLLVVASSKNERWTQRRRGKISVSVYANEISS